MNEVYMLTQIIRELERRGHNARPLRLLLASGNEFDRELRSAIRTLFCVFCLYPVT